MTERRTVAIRVDVDTLAGLRKGVPRLLEVFGDLKVQCSFFVVMGPDAMGRRFKRLGQKNYLKRILKVNPFRLIRNYGVLPFLYGTLLPPPKVGAAHPDILRDISRRGHELAPHGYDHDRWADHYFTDLSDDEIRTDFSNACGTFVDACGRAPRSFGAPNWRSDFRVYAAESEAGMLYASDLRGRCPFFPCEDGRRADILQIPVTLPCAHEVLQAGVSKQDIASEIVGRLVDGLNIWCIHGWFEGMSEWGVVREFVSLAREAGYGFVRMDEVAEELARGKEAIPGCGIGRTALTGGIGEVTCQAMQA